MLNINKDLGPKTLCFCNGLLCFNFSGIINTNQKTNSRLRKMSNKDYEETKSSEYLTTNTKDALEGQTKNAYMTNT